jgi:two-component sensor histidine kinase
VHIHLDQDPLGQHTLTVSDDGVGLPDGFDLQTSRSLGLQLVHRLVSQLQGTIQITDHRGIHAPGVTVTITFSEPRNDRGE